MFLLNFPRDWVNSQHFFLVLIQALGRLLVTIVELSTNDVVEQSNQPKYEEKIERSDHEEQSVSEIPNRT